MSQPIQLSLPLSALALRLGADFLNSLAEHAEAIRAEAEPTPVYRAVGEVVHATGVTHLTNVHHVGDPVEVEGGGASQGFHASVEIRDDKPLHTSGAHGDFAEIFEEPVIEYETQVIGVERNPEYTGTNAQFSHEQMTEAGWSDEALIADGYLIEVTAQVPKAPAAATVPTPPAPPGAASAASAADTVLDADGFPWDERIHSNAAEKLAKDGRWKTRKNLAEGYKAKIEAELRAAASGTTVSPSAPAQAPAAPSAPPAAPPAPAAAAAPAAPTPPAASGGMDFKAFTRWALGHVNAKALSNTDVALAIQAVGLTIMPDLAKQPDKIPQVVADLTAKFNLK